MSRLRVLITNTMLVGHSGTECHVRDLACGLLRRGHAPVIYSTFLGGMAHELEPATIPVVDDLRRLGETPDIIHGHHFPETLTALLHFPGVPAVGVCHDWSAWHDAPVTFPRLRRYAAVDETCRDRLVQRHGLSAERVRVIGNAVDLARFPARAPLPSQPRRALVFSNYAAAGNFLDVVRAACAQAELTVDVLGNHAGTEHSDPGAALGQYDLVFAKARCALEAMAVGCAVILCGIEGGGPLVTSGRFDELRRWNFGRRALRLPVQPAALLQEIARYDPADAAVVAQRVRAEANVETMLDAWLALYRDVIEEQRAPAADWLTESRATAEGIRWLMPYYREITRQGDLLAKAQSECRQLQIQWQQAEANWQFQNTQRQREIDELRHQFAQRQRFGSLCRSLLGRMGRKVLKVVSFPLRAAGQ
jgi:glycosyltransferase involved in cell wall biosynthesis